MPLKARGSLNYGTQCISWLTGLPFKKYISPVCKLLKTRNAKDVWQPKAFSLREGFAHWPPQKVSVSASTGTVSPDLITGSHPTSLAPFKFHSSYIAAHTAWQMRDRWWKSWLSCCVLFT